MKYEVIDNFLDEEDFDSLVSLFREDATCMEMPWFFQSSVAYPKKHKNWVVEDKLFYMIHMLYDGNAPVSSFYNKMIPLLTKLGSRCLIRIKANLYPNTEILHEHPMHTDYDYCHSSAILSLNTCDGYTKLKDGTKIDSVANRVLLFDSSEKHCSTTTTNVSARINININFINAENKIQE
jgi:hypothetical protein